jgi:isoquinoline 1-oxidoreductase beta subunit
MQNHEPGLSRRNFLKTTLAAGTGLVVSAQLPGCSTEGQSKNSHRSGHAAGFFPNAWITVHPDDTVTVMVNHSEMGQGITTALCMIVAEELEADWSKVRFEIAPVADIYKHPTYGIQWTVSSRSVESSWDLLREAAAMARELLIAAAADSWGVTPADCRAVCGRVRHRSGTQSISYGRLVHKAAAMPSPGHVRLKQPHEFSIIGRPVHRLDGEVKINGSAKFGTDIRVKGMLTATVIHPPVFGAGITSDNRREILTLPGVRQVMAIESGLAIVADTFWQAKSAMEKAAVQWESNELDRVDSDKLFERWTELGRQEGKAFYETGDADAIFENAGRILEATYDLPYQAHATPEPMNCTADVREDACDIWAPTQNQKGSQEIAAKITGLACSAITVHTTYLGGGFGRRALVDYVGEAVQLSLKMKTPVKVMWTREEDIRRDFYRPATHNRMQAVVDGKGNPLAWRHRIVGADAFGQCMPRIMTAMMPDAVPRFIKNAADFLAGRVMPGIVSGKKAVLGAGPLPYAIENMRVEFIDDDPGIPTCWWRSVAPSSNCFAVECFIDEIAAASGRDPFDLRCELLAGAPRLLNVVRIVAEKAHWHLKPAGNIHRGMACHNFQNTMVAMVAEVSVLGNGEITVHRVVCAVDCGVAVNPKTIEAQIQSGVVFGLSATLKSAVTVKNGVTQESNFDDFPILRFDEMPLVSTHIVTSTRPPTGIGEVAVPVIAPAVANAVFAATGRPVRKLPIEPQVSEIHG